MLKQKAFISLGSNLIIYFVGFFSSIIVARYMGAAPLGVLSTSQSFVNIFGILGGFGFGLAHFKRVSEDMDLGKCNGTFFTIKAFLSVFMFGAIILIYYGIGWTTGEFILDEKYHAFFWIIVIAFTIGNISQSIQLTFSARLEVTKNAIYLIAQKLTNSGLKIIVAIAGMSFIFLAWSNFVAVIVSVLIAVYLFRNYPIAKFDKATFKSYLAFAAPITIVQFLDKGALYLDKVFISYFVNEAEVGFYAVAQSLTNILLFASFMFVNLLIPTYSKMHAQEKYEEMRLFSGRIYRILSLLVTPLLIFIAVYARPIIMLLYGDGFTESVILLRILAIQILFYYYLQPFLHLITGSDKPKIVAIHGSIAALTNIILNLIFIPAEFAGFQMLNLGAEGAAWALLISVIIRFTLFRISAGRLFKIKYNYHILIHGVIALIFAGLSYYLLMMFLSDSNFFLLLAGSFLTFLLYGGLLWLTEEMNIDDIRFYTTIFRYQDTKSTVMSEFNNGWEKK